MVIIGDINLVTGLPGAGKTLFAIDLLRKCKDEGFVCYNFNVNQLDPELAAPYPFESIEQLNDLPERSVLIVDESHKVFPVRHAAAKNPPHIEALAEIRHHGRRLILIDQDPATLDRFVKRRVGSHYHLSNRSGFNRATLYSHRGCIDNPRATGAFATGENETWVYPQELFGKYKSASMHIKKKRIPRQLIWAGAAVVTLIAVALTLIFRDRGPDPIEKAEIRAESEGRAASSTRGFLGGPATVSTPEQWIDRHRPLVEGVPWSAPVFAERQVMTTPDMLCVILGNSKSRKGECRCYTEQVTPLHVDHKTCVLAARGGVYNPYRQPMLTTQTTAFSTTPPTVRGDGVVRTTPAPPLDPLQSQPRTSSTYAGTQPPVAPFTGVR